MDDDDPRNEKDCQVIIEEIEPTTLERKQLNEEFIANTKENDINIINTGISEEPNGNQKFRFLESVLQIIMPFLYNWYPLELIISHCRKVGVE